MNVEQIMKLVDAYVNACVDLESENNNYGTVDGGSVRFTDDARNEVLVALEQLTKDAARYRAGREAEYAGLMPTFIRPGKTWADAMDSAYDAAIAASKEQV